MSRETHALFYHCGTMPCVTGQNVGRPLDGTLYLCRALHGLSGEAGKEEGPAGLEHFEAPSESPIFSTGKFAAHPSSQPGWDGMKRDGIAYPCPPARQPSPSCGMGASRSLATTAVGHTLRDLRSQKVMSRRRRRRKTEERHSFSAFFSARRSTARSGRTLTDRADETLSLLPRITRAHFDSLSRPPL